VGDEKEPSAALRSRKKLTLLGQAQKAAMSINRKRRGKEFARTRDRKGMILDRRAKRPSARSDTEKEKKEKKKWLPLRIKGKNRKARSAPNAVLGGGSVGKRIQSAMKR